MSLTVHFLSALRNQTEVGREIYGRRGLAALKVTDEVFESPASVVSPRPKTGCTRSRPSW
jgi:hypothetical protein